MTAVREENAYYVRSSVIKSDGAAAIEDMDIWHKRLGHANRRIIEEMKKENLVIGMKEDGKEKRQCEPCVEGKMCRRTHPRLTDKKTSRITEL